MIADAHRMITDVKRAIDMNGYDTRLLSQQDTDTLEFEEIVQSQLLPGCRLVVENAPAWKLESGHDFKDQDIVWDGESGRGAVVLPADFCRLIGFRMSDWERPISEPQLLRAGTPAYDVQFSRYGALRGNPERPVAALVIREEGRCLEFFSCRTTKATIERADYQPWPHRVEDAGIDLPRKCYEAAIYAVASLVLSTYNDAQAQTMMNLSNQFLSAAE